MAWKDFRSFMGSKRLRSGALFSRFFKVPNPDFDLDALGEAAVEHERDEPDPTDELLDGGGPQDADDPPLPSPLSSPLSSAPSSPLTSAPSSCNNSRAPSPAPSRCRPPSRQRSPSHDSSHSTSLAPLPQPSADASQARSAAAGLDSHAAAPVPCNVKVSGRKRRRREHGHAYRRKKRKVEDALNPHPERRRRHAEHVMHARAKEVAFALSSAAVTSTGFRGKYEKGTQRTYKLRQLLKMGFVYLPWDGRETVPIVAPQPVEVNARAGGSGRKGAAGASRQHAPSPASAASEHTMRNVVIGVLAGRPVERGAVRSGPQRAPQQSWDAVADALADAIEGQRSRATFPKAAREHRRGLFGAQAHGISHGGGQMQPANLKHCGAMAGVLAYLVGLQEMTRVAHFASSVFATWAPMMHAYYGETLLALLHSDSDLERNFAASVWACITVNFGPRTITYPHRDYANFSAGWCAITALGRFNPDKGGHLVLWECRTVIRFPPGSTVHIPSAILTHANTQIAEDETRYSVTQYSAGALFRWVEHGFQLDEAYFASLSREEVGRDRATTAGRWARARAMLSTLEDLAAAAEKTVGA